MADTKISALPTTSFPAPADLFPISHSLSSYAITISSAVQSINSSIPGLTLASASSAVQAVNSTLPNLTFSTSKMGATVTLSSLNTFKTGVSMSLAAGTWMIHATALVGRDTALASTLVYARLHDGTNEFSNASATLESVVSTYVSLPLTAIITYGATSTLNLDATATVATSFLRARPYANGATSTATQICALKIA